MGTRMRQHIRSNVYGLIAIFIAIGGTAYASHPGGANTISSPDIINGEVKEADIGQGAVTNDEIENGTIFSADIRNDQVLTADLDNGAVNSAKLADGQVLTGDIGNGQVMGVDVANDNLTGTDIAPNSLKGADVDEETLDIGDAARAYAVVDALVDCTGTPGTCTPEQSKGISSVTRAATGIYCVTAPGIDATVTPAAVTVEYGSTAVPGGNASAMTRENIDCGPTSDGFVVITERQPEILVNAGSGTDNAEASGPAELADDVSFTIVIP